MRPTFVVLLALAPIVAGGGAAAQDSLRRAVTLPGGTTMTRQCAQWRSEGIVILTADSREPGRAAPAYLARLAAAMERRLMHVSTDSTVLISSFAARLVRSGSVSGVRIIKPSGRDGFDMDARVAADLAKGDPILVAMPPSVPDSLVVLISIGRRQDGSDFILQHEYCPAVALPDNPPPEYPATPTESVMVRAVRPVAMGRADTARRSRSAACLACARSVDAQIARNSSPP